jgi:excinuclease UvrABC nuclease subunit
VIRDHYVYVARDADEVVLYVGCTGDLRQRRAAHASTSIWWQYMDRITIHGPYERDTAYRIESQKIRDLAPYFNVAMAHRIHNKRRDTFATRTLRRLCVERGIRTGPGASNDDFPAFQAASNAADLAADAHIGPRITDETRHHAYIATRAKERTAA